VSTATLVADNESHVNVEVLMLRLALMFLIVAVIAGALGLTGVAGVASNIAWILFVIGLVFAVVFFVLGRRPPTV